MGELGEGQGEDAGGDVVEHDALAVGEALELADGWGFEDVEGAEEEEGEQGVGPVGGDGDEGDELSGDFVDDDVAGVFAAGLVRDDGGGGDADDGGGDGGDEGADSEDELRGVQRVGGSVPEEDGGDGAVGSWAGAQESCSEEGADEPGPEGAMCGKGFEVFLFGHGRLRYISVYVTCPSRLRIRLGCGGLVPVAAQCVEVNDEGDEAADDGADGASVGNDGTGELVEGEQKDDVGG